MPPRSWPLREAARWVRAGGVIAYPTEAVYGLGCDPLNRAAVEHLLELKQRPITKGLILVGAHYSQLTPFVKQLPEPKMQRVAATWPGPTTWLLPANSDTPDWLTGGRPSVAVRVTDHPMAGALCRVCNSALVSTSANISTRTPARTALGVYNRFGTSVDFVVHGNVGSMTRPTPIQDAMTGRLVRA